MHDLIWEYWMNDYLKNGKCLTLCKPKSWNILPSFKILYEMPKT